MNDIMRGIVIVEFTIYLIVFGIYEFLFYPVSKVQKDIHHRDFYYFLVWKHFNGWVVKESGTFEQVNRWGKNWRYINRGILIKIWEKIKL